MYFKWEQKRKCMPISSISAHVVLISDDTSTCAYMWSERVPIEVRSIRCSVLLGILYISHFNHEHLFLDNRFAHLTWTTDYCWH